MPVYHLLGPDISKVSREQAEIKLLKKSAMPKGAEYDLWEQNGRWVAAWHQSGPPFDGPPADSEDEAPGPKSEGPEDTAPESPDGPPKPDDDGEDGDKPPTDDGEGGEKKEKGEHGKGEDVKLDHEIFDLLQKIVVALGIDVGGPEDSPVPGEEGPPAPPPPGPPGPPAGGPPGAGGPDKDIKHERALKPGEAPPGTTPIGAPAFSSVADDHPWRDLILANSGDKKQVASFFVEESWPADRPVAEFEGMARKVAHGTGFEVRQTRRGQDKDGNPTVRALIQSTDLSLG